jgi:hypothetical protein
LLVDLFAELLTDLVAVDVREADFEEDKSGSLFERGRKRSFATRRLDRLEAGTPEKPRELGPLTRVRVDDQDRTISTRGNSSASLRSPRPKTLVWALTTSISSSRTIDISL